MLQREERHRAGARLFLFRGGARLTLGGQAAHQGPGAPHGGELRQAAGAAGTAPENANGLQRERRVSMTVSKRFSRLRCQLSRDVLFLLGSNNPGMPG